jgi:DNA-binding transcriptional ArsR family regulator
MSTHQIFKALGDPIRLRVIERLTDGSIHTIGTLSAGLGVSRQGARKQIQVLVLAKLVVLEPVGRETNVVLNTAALESGRAFIARIESQWDQRLQALKQFVE